VDADTLVVDTIGIKTFGEWLSRMPHSEQMHITERFKLSRPTSCNDQITIEDPVVLEKPRSTRWPTSACRTMRWSSSSATIIASTSNEKGVVRLR